MARWILRAFQAISLSGLLLTATGAAAAQTARATPKVVRSLAPEGRLRVAINLGNTVLAQKDPATGKLGGVTVVLAEALGKRLGVPVEMTSYDAAGKVFDALEKGAWDVAFLGNEPERAQKIDFTPPYVFIDGTYLVRKDSPIRGVEDADKPGYKITVGRGAAYDLFLTRNLKNAQLVRGDTGAVALATFKSEKLDAMAGVRQFLMDAAEKDPSLRVLDSSFMRIDQSVAVPRGRSPQATRFVRQFLEEMKANGTVRRALDESGQRGAKVAPPAK